MYTRSASSSRSRAASRSPSASRTRAMAIRQRCRFCGRPMCSPSSSACASSCLARPRSLRSRWSALIPTYMSAVPRSTGPSVLVRELQGLLVGAHRVAEPALGDPDVGQRDRAPEYVGQVTRSLHARRALGVRRVGCLEIAARPGREPDQRRGRSTPDVVVLVEEVQSPLGVGDRAWKIAQHQRQPGAVDGECQPGAGGTPRRRRRPSGRRALGSRTCVAGSSSQRSASCRCRSTPSMVPVDSSAAT